MVQTKKIIKRLKNWLKMPDLLVFVLLVLFPFGQLLRFNLDILGVAIPVHPFDLCVLATVLTFPVFDKSLGKLVWFGLFAIFSYMVSLGIFPEISFTSGGFYLLRLTSYIFLAAFLLEFVNKKEKKKDLLLKSLLLVIVFSAIFGWIQYFWFPDLRALVEYGWDDHLYRLAGTFLDPGFTSIVLVIGFLISLNLFLKSRSKKYLWISIFLTLTLAFTYSRAGFLAFLTGFIYTLWINKYRQIIKYLVLLLILGVFLLPKLPGEGTNLWRTRSITARLESTASTLGIVDSYPLLGVGYNNLCSVRSIYFPGDDYGIHSCSGVDNSLIFVWVTTGLAGLLLFLNLIFSLFKNSSKNIYGQVFKGATTAVLVHSFFTNTLFYPWVMAAMAILLSASRRVGDKDT